MVVSRAPGGKCAPVAYTASVRSVMSATRSPRDQSMAVRIENNAEPIPGYKLIERLGGGGFGDVWKVEAPGGLFKAIKFVYGDLQQTGEEGQRAGQELKALSRVK